MVTIRPSRPEDVLPLIAIWRAAVDATHDFLSAEDRVEIDSFVCRYFPEMAFDVAVNEGDHPIAFMAISGSHMDALFVDPAARGTGVGRLLVEHALTANRVMTTDVNEQNAQAVGFYTRLGFIPTGRSPTDDHGRPYPLIHLRRG